MYQRPYTTEEIKKFYPAKAEILLKDPVHLWRAATGIELIHKEPTFEEQERIWKNWNEMTDDMKSKSDAKSIELFGKDNASHNEEIMESWNLKIITFPKAEWSDIQKRFSEGKLVWTLRVSDECVKYNEGDVLQTEWGNKVKVLKKEKINGGISELKEKYQYFNELTPEMFDQLKKYDLIEILMLGKIGK